MRLDKYLQQQFDMSRARAQLEIKAGHVLINGQNITKPSTAVKEGDSVTMTESIPFVARSGEKLCGAIKEFHISVENKIALDIGSSTGGFVDCLLQKGAKKIYAVDVGSMQLHESLRENSKVILHENTDIRNFSKPNEINFDIISIDISFISITKILEKLKEFSNNNTIIIALIKPQFETEKEYKTRAGVLTEKQSKKIFEKTLRILKKDFDVLDTITSPIIGKKGNVEYLVKMKQG